MARLKVMAICMAVPVGVAATSFILIFLGSFDIAHEETAVGKAARLIQASCKSDALRPQLPTSLGLALLRHLRS